MRCTFAVPGVDERLVERDQRGFGHRKRRRLRHLQALRARHSVLDPAVDLREQLIDELFFEIDRWIEAGMKRPKRLKMAKPAALAMAEASLIPLD